MCEVSGMQWRSLMRAGALAGLSACSQGEKKPRLPDSAVVGVWQSDPVQSPVGAGRVYELRATTNGLAEFSSALNGADRRVERGTWDGADSLVRIVVRGDATGSRTASLLLARRAGTLALVQFDTTAWGPGGLVLRRR
jgi:hypothetical protein